MTKPRFTLFAYATLFPSFHAFWSLPFQIAGALYLLYRQVSDVTPPLNVRVAYMLASADTFLVCLV